jgi:hypothetical protein
MVHRGGEGKATEHLWPRAALACRQQWLHTHSWSLLTTEVTELFSSLVTTKRREPEMSEEFPFILTGNFSLPFSSFLCGINSPKFLSKEYDLNTFNRLIKV